MNGALDDALKADLIDVECEGSSAALVLKLAPGHHPGVELRENFKSISHRCHLFEVAFVWELTKETICLLLGCL